MQLSNLTQKCILARSIRLCDGYWSRMRGLLGTKSLEPNEACWIIPCNSVHTFGMKYPLDIFFLDKNLLVVSIIKNLKPGRLSPVAWKAHSTLEMISSAERIIQVGDQLELKAL